MSHRSGYVLLRGLEGRGACQLESTPVNPGFCPAGGAHLLRIALGWLSRCEAPTDPAKTRPQATQHVRTAAISVNDHVRSCGPHYG